MSAYPTVFHTCHDKRHHASRTLAERVRREGHHRHPVVVRQCLCGGWILRGYRKGRR